MNTLDPRIEKSLRDAEHTSELQGVKKNVARLSGADSAQTVVAHKEGLLAIDVDRSEFDTRCRSKLEFQRHHFIDGPHFLLLLFAVPASTIK
jgi:hypothetical protein